MNYTTRQWTRWWKSRPIDWAKDYLSTHNHPHRDFIVAVLLTFHWTSLLEVGCGAGANLVNLVKRIPGRQLGGIDINPEAIRVAQETLKEAFLKVCPMDDIMMSDNSTDVVLSDMSLIYIDPFKIDKVIKEIKRIARMKVVFCEFHTSSLYERIKVLYNSGYHAYNYKKLLEKHGFYDVMFYKLPKETWPGGYQEKIGFIITARK